MARVKFRSVMQRDEAAKRALRLWDSIAVKARAIEAVEDEFDLSTPSARNLVNRGIYLREHPNG